LSKKQVEHRIREQGFALVVVIMVMLLISFLAAELTLSVRTDQQIAFHAKARAAGICLASGGVNMGIFHLLDKPAAIIEGEDDFFLGRTYEEILENGRISYYVVSESGKINLNKFNKKILALFLESMNIDEEQQTIIKDSLLDWQDSNDLHRLNGAESDYYESLDDPYIPRNGNIQDPSEFFLVRGTEELAGKFVAADIFTVHNRSDSINFNSLSPLMLDFLTQGDKEKKEAYREARDTHEVMTASLAHQILGDERFAACSSALVYKKDSSKVYTIVAKGEPGRMVEEKFKPEGRATEVRALIELRGDKVRYLAWQEN
jgi:general secretion pathway protein K